MAEKKRVSTGRASRAKPGAQHGGRRSGPEMARSGDWRVVLSTRRNRYWLQLRDPGSAEGWTLCATVEDARLLARECMMWDAPETLTEGLPLLPSEAAAR